MSEVDFQALSPLVDQFVQREPRLEKLTPYRSRDELRFALPVGFWQRLVDRELLGPLLVEREGLQSVIENACRGAEAECPDSPADDPATVDLEFTFQCEREGMNIEEPLQALVIFKRNGY
ncbi:MULTISPECIES: hypothetical protein [unclassified Pseudomonas]|uniref:hypothetical protein n=1 Tax=unclassified Pseudomonas TaxID=196821 RepID=UPI001B33FCF6|nr:MULTISPECIES: hypothetical protein [unclassified Pseudomonas]